MKLNMEVIHNLKVLQIFYSCLSANLCIQLLLIQLFVIVVKKVASFSLAPPLPQYLCFMILLDICQERKYTLGF